MKAILFVFSSEENYRKYSSCLKRFKEYYVYSIEELKLYESDKKAQNINTEEYFLIFSDGGIGFLNHNPKFKLLERFDILNISRDIVEEINQSCLINQKKPRH